MANRRQVTEKSMLVEGPHDCRGRRSATKQTWSRYKGGRDHNVKKLILRSVHPTRNYAGARNSPRFRAPDPLERHHTMFCNKPQRASKTKPESTTPQCGKKSVTEHLPCMLRGTRFQKVNNEEHKSRFQPCHSEFAGSRPT